MEEGEEDQSENRVSTNGVRGNPLTGHRSLQGINRELEWGRKSGEDLRGMSLFAERTHPTQQLGR